MAFVHPQSCECTKSELDLFVVPPTQTSIESGVFVEYNPIATISQGNPIEFSITGAGQDYIDLSNSQLYVRAQIVKANNDAADAGDHLTQSVFRSRHYLERHARNRLEQYVRLSQLLGNGSELRRCC
jgi:hypothetical protein